jgi:release factor glutamine methyltransferase
LRVKLALVDRRRYERVVLEDVCGIPVLVLPDVFNPKLLRSGEFLVQQLQRRELLPKGSRVLDLGCGAGAAGVAAAQAGCTVVAVDINPAAVRCTRINALLNNLEIDIRQGDLFEPVQGERFDVILFNPPYYRGVPRDPLDHAWRSTDVIERFAGDLKQHLAPGGHALVVLSSDGEGAYLLDALQHQGCESSVAAERDFLNEVMRVHRVQAC